jgi:tetratricopeptide (TPR) repeat protein
MLWFLLSLFAVPVRVTFVRTVPAAHDLKAERVAVAYAIGDNEKVTSFVDYLVAYAGRSGTIRIENVVENNKHLGSFSESALQSLRKDHPAEAYIGVSLFTCAGAERRGEVGETNAGGERVRSKVQWLDVVCSAKLDVRNASGKPIATFMTHGEGTSPRVAALGNDERDIAYEQATRFAAIAAAESFVPRMIREAIELDDRAPAFEDAAVLVKGDRLEDARAVWEAALTRHRNSASLNFNLGAIAEAMGDLEAADRYFRSAASLAPKEARFRTALSEFRKRNGAKPRP